MARKRRTRAQKQRAASRRHLPVLLTAPAATPASTRQADTEVSSRPTSKISVLLRPRDLRTSLWLLGSLLGVQVLLWLVFQLTQLDEALYDWIKI